MFREVSFLFIQSILFHQECPALYLKLQTFMATQSDEFRKPETGMWEFFVKHCNKGAKPGTLASRLALAALLHKDNEQCVTRPSLSMQI